MMRLVGTSLTNRSASVGYINKYAFEYLRAKDTGAFQMFWGLQDALVALTF